MNGTDRAGGVPRPRRKVWLRLGVPGAVALCAAALVGFSAREVLTPSVPVRVAPVVFRTVSGEGAVPAASAPAGRHAGGASSGSGATVQAPGWVEPEPFPTACTALADGVVESVLVLEGERVEKGQVVARLVGEDAALALQRAEAGVATARAEVALMRAERDAAQREWDNPVERVRSVESARAALMETEAEMARVPSKVEAERARLVRVEQELALRERAAASLATSEFELIAARADAAAQRATVADAEGLLAVLAAQRERLRAELKAAEEHLRLRIDERRRLDGASAALERAGAALLNAEAERDEAALRVSRMTITAPISGVVQRRHKAPGDKVMLGMDDPASAQVLWLYDPARLQVRVDVPLADASHVRIGQRAEVVVEVLPDRVFRGVVTRVTNEADLQKNTLQVKVAIEQPSALLKPEMLARVKFIAQDSPGDRGDAAAPGEVLVRREAVGEGGRVWVVVSRRGERGVAEVRTVRTGEADATGWVLVREGLRAGDLAVISETGGLREGMRLRVVGAEGGAS